MPPPCHPGDIPLPINTGPRRPSPNLGPVAFRALDAGATGDVEGVIGVEGDSVGAALHGVLAKGVRNFYA